MPVVAGVPITQQAPTVVSPYLDSRQLGFEALDGSDMLPFTGTEFIARNGIQGIDLLPRTVVESKRPGEIGTRIDSIDIDSRKVFLPLWLGSDSSHSDYLSKRDRVATMFSHFAADYRNTDGTFNLVGVSERGTRRLRCLYVDGMNGDVDTDTGGTYWEALGLNLLSVRASWYGSDWASATITQPAPDDFFASFPPALASSQAIGSPLTVVIPGDVPSPATIEIDGPCRSATITGPGLSISIPNGVAGGEHVTIVTDSRGRTALFNSVKDWSRIAPAGRMFNPLPTGTQTLSIAMSNISASTRAWVHGTARWERPW